MVDDNSLAQFADVKTIWTPRPTLQCGDVGMWDSTHNADHHHESSRQLLLLVRGKIVRIKSRSEDFSPLVGRENC